MCVMPQQNMKIEGPLLLFGQWSYLAEDMEQAKGFEIRKACRLHGEVCRLHDEAPGD